MLAMLGPEDLTIVLLLGAVIFGAKKIPELARSLGRAKGEFHRGLIDGDSAPQTEQALSEPKESADAPLPVDTRRTKGLPARRSEFQATQFVLTNEGNALRGIPGTVPSQNHEGPNRDKPLGRG